MVEGRRSAGHHSKNRRASDSGQQASPGGHGMLPDN
jgi:hypothetical protein